ncbi:MAG: signal peptidase II [Planctomycetota bacterium]
MNPSPPAASPSPHGTGAGRSRSAWIWFVVILIGATTVDLVSKDLAFARIAPAPVQIERAEVIEAQKAGRPLGTLLPRHDPVVVVPRTLEFTLVLNKGAVFGLGAGGRWFFVAATVAAIGFGMWMFLRWTGPRDHLAHAAIALVLAGGLGNLYDRIVFACVRDFLHPLPGLTYPFGISTPWSGREVWPYVSNIADLFLLIGVAGIMLFLLQQPQPSDDLPDAPPPNDLGV